MSKDNGSTPLEITEEFSLAKISSADFLNGGGYELLSSGSWKIDLKTDKIVPKDRSKPAIAPWLYIRPHKEMKCGMWHQIMFKHFNIMAKGCLKCWKVVVKPRTVKELFELSKYQSDVYNKPCKCGIEIRKFVFGNYGGYFYNTSLEEGLETYNRVLADMARYIFTDLSMEEIEEQGLVRLKRACTEYELKFGDSSKWEDGGEYGNMDWDRWANVEAMVEHNVQITNPDDPTDSSETVKQAGIVKVAVVRGWLDFAYDRGDESVLDFNEPDRYFYTPSITYHNKEEVWLQSINTGVSNPVMTTVDSGE